MLTTDAGEQAAGERRRAEAAVEIEKQIADAALGELVALVEEEAFVVAVVQGADEFAVVEGAAGGFVAEPGVAGVDALAGYADAEIGGGSGERNVGDFVEAGGKKLKADALWF